MGELHFTDEERGALPSPADTSDAGWAERQRRFRAFDDLAFSIMKRAILAGDITEDVIQRTERRIIAGLRNMPEALAEFTLYTRQITVTVTGENHYSGWFWARYTSRKYLNAQFEFGPYGSSISAWTDPTAPDGVVRFQ